VCSTKLLNYKPWGGIIFKFKFSTKLLETTIIGLGGEELIFNVKFKIGLFYNRSKAK